MKGPPGKKKVMEASAAHQIFGRAGRPQFDTEGYVYVLAHEDDVRIARWAEKYNQIPLDTKDPGLLKARKALDGSAEAAGLGAVLEPVQFQKLVASPPGKLLQPRTAPLAAPGVHARRLAGGRSDPHAWWASG